MTITYTHVRKKPFDQKFLQLRQEILKFNQILSICFWEQSFLNQLFVYLFTFFTISTNMTTHGSEVNHLNNPGKGRIQNASDRV